MLNEISAVTATSSDSVLQSSSTTRYMSGPADTGNAEQAEGVSFSATMADVTQEALDKIQQGEAAAISGVDGQASVQQVVEAVLQAETTLQTAIAIRDKVVGAYQEISRMTI